MTAIHTITRLSTGTKPAIHRYYDNPVESPDGKHILFFEFDGPIPGPGTVMIADPQGGNPQAVARPPTV